MAPTVEPARLAAAMSPARLRPGIQAPKLVSAAGQTPANTKRDAAFAASSCGCDVLALEPSHSSADMPSPKMYTRSPPPARPFSSRAQTRSITGPLTILPSVSATLPVDCSAAMLAAVSSFGMSIAVAFESRRRAVMRIV